MFIQARDAENGHLYHYTPSLVAAVLFIVLFGLTTLFHVYQVIRWRCWYFSIFVIGGGFQVIGYVCRALGHFEPNSIPLYTVGIILILIAPPLYAASIYMTLSRVIRHLRAEHLSLIRVKFLTFIFVLGDVISFVAQAQGGGSMADDDPEKRESGQRTTIGGLIVQLVFFSVFIIVATLFHVRVKQNPTRESCTTHSSAWNIRFVDWRGIMCGLYLSSALILIRSIFRLIEFIQGNDGYLSQHEVFVYVFDSALMFLTMVVMNFFHPSSILSPKLQGGREASGSCEAGAEMNRLRSF